MQSKIAKIAILATTLLLAAPAHSEERDIRQALLDMFRAQVNDLSDFDEDICGTAPGPFILESNSGVWTCGSPSTGSALDVEENNVSVDAAVTNLDFLGADFDVTPDGAGETDISIAAAIARDSELHAQSHAVTSASDHTVGGFPTGAVLTVTSGTTFSWGQVDLANTTAAVTGVLPDANVATTIARDSEVIDETGAPPSGTLTECVWLDAGMAIQVAAGTATQQIVEGTNFPYPVYNLDDTTDEQLTWNYKLPKNIDGTTATVSVSWTALACTATTADDVCFVWNGGGFQDDDPFSTGALSGTEAFAQHECTVAGDIQTSPYTTWTHGYDVTGGAKDTDAVFQIIREQVSDATCTGTDNAISGDVQMRGVNICYEVENLASGEGA